MKITGLLLRSLRALQEDMLSAAPSLWSQARRDFAKVLLVAEDDPSPAALELTWTEGISLGDLEDRDGSRAGDDGVALRKLNNQNEDDDDDDDLPCCEATATNAADSVPCCEEEEEEAIPIGEMSWGRFYDYVTEINYYDMGILFSIRLTSNPWYLIRVPPGEVALHQADFASELRLLSTLNRFKGQRGVVTLYTPTSPDQLDENDIVVLILQPFLANLGEMCLLPPHLFPLESRLLMFAQMLRAVCEMNEAGATHRSLALENIQVVGECTQAGVCGAVLCDLQGICTLPGGRWPLKVTHGGRAPLPDHPGFDRLTVRNDMWLLGLALYRLMFAGTVPFTVPTGVPGVPEFDLYGETWTPEEDSRLRELAKYDEPLANLIRRMLSRGTLLEMSLREASDAINEILREKGIEDDDNLEMQNFAEAWKKGGGSDDARVIVQQAMPPDLELRGAFRFFLDDLAGIMDEREERSQEPV